MLIPNFLKRNLILRRLLALFYAKKFGFPQRKMNLIGITGTNGKTTTSFLLKHILEQNNILTGLIGSNGYWIDKETKISPTVIGKAPVTTPDPWLLYKLLYEMLSRKIHTCIMEVSSFGLLFQRVYGLDFKVAILTNVSHSHHIKIHRSFKRYLETKKNLFRQLSPSSIAILPRDSHFFSEFAQITKARIISYGFSSQADISARIISTQLNSLKAEVKTPKGKVKLNLPFPGKFNLLNSLAALSAALVLNLDLSSIIHSLESAVLPEGRWEIIASTPFRVIVDKANTPQALREIIQLIQGLPVRRKIVVYGNFEEFPLSIRRQLAQITTDFFDLTIITVDDTKYGDPQEGIKDFLDYVKSKGIPENKYLAITDRRKAIAKALSLAQKNDIILILGRGNEEKLVLGNKIIDFNDIKVTKELLTHLR